MFFEVEWSELGEKTFRRTYKAEDFYSLWRAIKYMNMERNEKKRPIMKRIQITNLEKCDDGYFEITGDYETDMQIDEEDLE